MEFKYPIIMRPFSVFVAWIIPEEFQRMNPADEFKNVVMPLSKLIHSVDRFF